MQAIMRGDIFYADLNPYIGSEQGGVRPVLIVQNDIGNKYSSTVIVAAMTSRLDKPKLPTHIEINGCGLRENSIVCMEQIRTIDKCRLRDYIGHLDNEQMARVEIAINISFGIQNKKEGQAVSNLTLIENGIIPVYQSDKGSRLVNMRELHAWLGVGRDFSTWVRDRIERYGFTENQDFILFPNSGENSEGRPRLDYIFKLEPAKEIAMVENNEKGKQIRKYFILVEEKFKNQSLDISRLSPELQLFNQLFQAMAKNQLQLEETKQIAVTAQSEAAAAKETIREIKESLAELPKDQWRKWVTGSISEIVKSEKSKLNYEGVWNESYRLLEEKSRADLGTRVRNKRRRLTDAGATKSAIDSYCKLDAIEEDKYLKEIYTNIIQKMRIKYLV